MYTILSHRLRDEDGIYRLNVAQAIGIAMMLTIPIVAMVKVIAVLI